MTEPIKSNRTVESIGLELEWAASGAAAEIESLRARLAELQRTSVEQQKIIRELHGVAEERGELIRSLDTAIAVEREQYSRALSSYEAELAGGRAKAERLAAEADAQRELAETRRRMFEDESRLARRELLRLQELVESSKRAPVQQEIVDELRRACEERLLLVHDLTTRLTDLHVVAAERAALLEANAEALRQSQAESLILRQACEERLRLIDDLTASVSGDGSGPDAAG